MNIPATTARKLPCSQQAPDTYHERTQFDMSKRQNVVFIMSSHGTRRHYFEHQLNRVWREGFNMNISVNYPIVNARSGRKYDELLLTHYASILPTLTAPTVIIFNLGCNNLDAPVLAVAKTQVLLTIRKIIQMHANDDHSLIFTGIQPRWNHNRAQFRAVVDLDKRISLLIDSFLPMPMFGTRIGFAPILPSFLANASLIYRFFAPDGTHLSRAGASALAHRLCSIAFHASYERQTKPHPPVELAVENLPELPLENISGEIMPIVPTPRHNQPEYDSDDQIVNDSFDICRPDPEQSNENSALTQPSHSTQPNPDST